MKCREHTDQAPIHLSGSASRKPHRQKGRLPFCPLRRTTLDGMAEYREPYKSRGGGSSTPLCSNSGLRAPVHNSEWSLSSAGGKVGRCLR